MKRVKTEESTAKVIALFSEFSLCFKCFDTHLGIMAVLLISILQ